MADPYLRFWLAFLDPHMAEIERIRGDLTLSRIKERWTSWRGRAIEPLIRESLAPLLPDGVLPASPAISGYWTRGNDVEIDLVGADRQPVAKRLLFLGSVKWLENSAFDSHDLAALQKHRAAIPAPPQGPRPLPRLAQPPAVVECLRRPRRARHASTTLEAMGLVALEAQACGLPVVYQPVPGLSDTLAATGLATDFTKPAVLARDLNRLRNTPSLLTALQATGHTNAARYPLTATAAALDNLGKQLA